MINTKSKLVVRYYETDQMGVTHHSNYLRYFEVGRSDFMRDIGYPYSTMEEDGCMSPIMSITIRYVRPSGYEDLLTIETEMRELPESTDQHAVFYQNIYNEKGKLVAGGTVKVAFINSSTKKREQIPARLMEAMNSYLEN